MNIKLELDHSISKVSDPKLITMSLETFNDLITNYIDDFSVNIESRSILYKNYHIGFKKMRYGDYIVSNRL